MSDIDRLDLAFYLRRHVDNPAHPPVKQIADSMNCSAVHIYKILEGERDIKLSDLPAFCRAAGVPIEALKCLVTKCDPSLALIRVKERARINGSFDDEKDDLAVLQGKLVAGIREALRDGVIDEDERQCIVDRATDIRDTMDRVIAEANALACGNGR